MIGRMNAALTMPTVYREFNKYTFNVNIGKIKYM